MNDNPTPSGITRRSFIKRSVVAAVAVSNMTIFSGLVRAEFEEYGVSIPPPCGLTLEPYEWTFDDKIITVWKCSATGPVCDKEIFCGRMYEMDPFTGDPHDGAVGFAFVDLAFQDRRQILLVTPRFGAGTISQLEQGAWRATWTWGFTPLALRRLLEPVFEPAALDAGTSRCMIE